MLFSQAYERAYIQDDHVPPSDYPCAFLLAVVAEQRAQWMTENCDKLAPAFVEKARLAPAYWKAQLGTVKTGLDQSFFL